MGKSMKIHDLLHFFEAKIDFYEATLECTNKWFQYLRDKKKKKERRGLRKRGGGVKIHPFHLPWIRACYVGYGFGSGSSKTSVFQVFLLQLLYLHI